MDLLQFFIIFFEFSSSFWLLSSSFAPFLYDLMTIFGVIFRFLSLLCVCMYLSLILVCGYHEFDIYIYIYILYIYIHTYMHTYTYIYITCLFYVISLFADFLSLNTFYQLYIFIPTSIYCFYNIFKKFLL